MKNKVFHPLCVAAAPVLFLYAANYFEVNLPIVLRPLLLCLLFSSAVFGLSRVIFKSWMRGGLVASLFLLLFFTYGRLYEIFSEASLAGISLGHHRYILALDGLLLAAGIVLAIKVKKITPLNVILNGFGIICVLLPLLQIATFTIRQAYFRQNQPKSAFLEEKTMVDSASLPDIYYIVLDSYMRADSLREELGFDNQAFLDDLRSLGFIVADCSRSNYAFTELSLASSLNMDYLENLSGNIRPGNAAREPVIELIQHGSVRRILNEAGYRIVAFETGYHWSEWTDAERYVTSNQSVFSFKTITPFESMLADATALSLFKISFFTRLTESNHWLYQEYIDRIQYTFSQVPLQGESASPSFVFVHILAPHYPYVFNPDGSIQTDSRYYNKDGEGFTKEYSDRGYLNQLQYVNLETLHMVNSILNNTRRPAIIILQGDHGQGGQGRFNILNAYYFPKELDVEVSTSITPVNSFRIVLNAILNLGLPHLPDHSYYSTYEDPYVFLEVPENSSECSGGGQQQ